MRIYRYRQVKLQSTYKATLSTVITFGIILGSMLPSAASISHLWGVRTGLVPPDRYSLVNQEGTVYYNVYYAKQELTAQEKGYYGTTRFDRYAISLEPGEYTRICFESSDWLDVKVFTDGNAAPINAYESAIQSMDIRSGEFTINYNSTYPTLYIYVGKDGVSPGTYSINYSLTSQIHDPSPNQAPTLSLLGDSEVTVECGSSFTDPGVTAMDPEDGDISGCVVIDSSNLDLQTPGTYRIEYAVSDEDGAAAEEITRHVIVVDSTPPVITLSGDASINMNCGDIYVEAGAIANDSCDASATIDVQTGGQTVDPMTPGLYLLTYDAVDNSGNVGITIHREVTVLDNCTALEGEGEGEGEGEAAIRILPSAYVPDRAFRVSISVHPAPNASAWALEEMPPTGWQVSSINENGVWDSATQKIKWGPFFEFTETLLRYTITPISSSSETVYFSGTLSTGGLNTPISGQTSSTLSTAHTADQDADEAIDLSELLRVIQFFNSEAFHCAEERTGTEDGYAPGAGTTLECTPHSSDYAPHDWAINLTELLRLIQFFNSNAYYACPEQETEDGYCPGEMSSL